MDRRELLRGSVTAATGALIGAIAQTASAQSAPAGPVATSGRLKTILDRGRLIVGIRSTTIGFGFKDAKGDLVGFDVDLAKEMARGLFDDPTKIQFEVFNGGAERAPALDSGRVDMVISQFSVLESRAQVLDFSIPYCNSDLGAVVRAASPYKKYADLNGKKVSTRQAEEVRQLIVAAVPKADVQMFPAYSDAFLAFRQGRVEAFFSDGAPMRYILREFGKEFRVLNDPTNLLDANQFSIGLKQGDQVFLNYVNWAVTRLRLTGRLAAIHRQWLGTEDLIPAWARGPI
jgi:polar amino acid transport system substrate-binding protein